MPGLVAAKVGADVTLTDNANSIEVIDFSMQSFITVIIINMDAFIKFTFVFVFWLEIMVTIVISNHSSHPTPTFGSKILWENDIQMMIEFEF